MPRLQNWRIPGPGCRRSRSAARHALATVLFGLCLSQETTRGESPPLDPPPTLPPSPARPEPVDRILRATTQELHDLFLGNLQDMDAYAARVEKECQVFPEGWLYPYVMPAIAFLRMSEAGLIPREDAIRAAAAYLQATLTPAAVRVRARDANLLNLETYGSQATILGTLNLAVGEFERITADRRFAAVHDHLSTLLRNALREAGGAPLRPYPTSSWTFDTMPVLLSLHIHDRLRGTAVSTVPIQQHLRWIRENGLDAATGLPHAQVDAGTGTATQPPRGCDLSFRLPMLSRFAPEFAAEMYRAYTRHYWLERGTIAGFAEWPEGKRQGGAGAADVDTGPIFQDIGMAATVLGMGCTLAFSDEQRLEVLSRQLAFARLAVRSAGVVQGLPAGVVDGWLGQTGLTLNPGYVSGTLFGDAVLFYALTLPDPRRQNPNK